MQYFVDIPYTELFSQNIAQADLFEAQIVAIPEDWLARDEAENEFRAQWAKREGLLFRDPFPDVPERNIEAEFQRALAKAQTGKNAEAEIGGQPFDARAFRSQWAREHGIALANPFKNLEGWEPERQFDLTWRAQRRTYLDTKPKPNLQERNLRKANLFGSFLPGVDLENARLENADLRSARLEDANLRYASLQGADLSKARLEHAFLFNARLEGADLRNAWLEKAGLFGARLEGANLSRTRLEGANLNAAKLTGANLSRARMQAAHLRQAQLKDADLTNANLEGADLRWARLERAELWEANLKGADLKNARFESTILQNIRLEDADLSFARLFGNNDDPLALGSADTLNGVNITAAALRFADLSGVKTEKLTGWSSTFGDGSVTLPDGINRPERWCERVLGDAEFFGRWRGHLDRGGNKRNDNQFDAHPPIPPSDC